MCVFAYVRVYTHGQDGPPTIITTTNACQSGGAYVLQLRATTTAGIVSLGGLLTCFSSIISTHQPPSFVTVAGCSEFNLTDDRVMAVL